MENNLTKTMNENPTMNLEGNLNTELQKAAIGQLPGLYGLGKQGMEGLGKVAESSIQATESMYKTASANSQEMRKAYAELLKDPNLSPEERARILKLLEEESAHANNLDETVPKQVQEIEKDNSGKVFKVCAILGGITLALVAPAATYGAYKLYQTYKNP